MKHKNPFRDMSEDVLIGFLYINDKILKARWGETDKQDYNMKKDDIHYTVEYDPIDGYNELVGVIPLTIADTYVKFGAYKRIIDLIDEYGLKDYEVNELLSLVFGD